MIIGVDKKVSWYQLSRSLPVLYRFLQESLGKKKENIIIKKSKKKTQLISSIQSKITVHSWMSG